MKHKTDTEIADESPRTAVTYCMYEYGDEMEGLYLNCEKQFFDSEEMEWVDMCLIEDYFHSHRRIDGIKNLNGLKAMLGAFRA